MARKKSSRVDEIGHKDGVGPTGSGVAGGDGGATGHVTAAADSLAEPVTGLWVTPDDTTIRWWRRKTSKTSSSPPRTIPA